MERKPEHTAIVERIEDMRCDLKLSKSKFCAAFGMKPQTYSNFIGQQGSKPNVELLMGVAEAYRPHDREGALAWIVWGVGGPGVSDDDRLSRVEAGLAQLEKELEGHHHEMDTPEETTYAIYPDTDEPRVVTQPGCLRCDLRNVKVTGDMPDHDPRCPNQLGGRNG